VHNLRIKNSPHTLYDTFQDYLPPVRSRNVYGGPIGKLTDLTCQIFALNTNKPQAGQNQFKDTI